MASFSFDSTTISPETKSDPIPSGTYIAQVVDSEVNPAKSGQGTNMKLVFEIIDGQFKNRKVFDNLCVQHVNAETQRIAQARLSALCHATGVVRMNDSSELHNRPIKINVGIQPEKNGYAAKNIIRGIEAANSGGFVPQQQAANFAPTAAKPSAAPAWANRAA